MLHHVEEREQGNRWQTIISLGPHSAFATTEGQFMMHRTVAVDHLQNPRYLAPDSRENICQARLVPEIEALPGVANSKDQDSLDVVCLGER